MKYSAKTPSPPCLNDWKALANAAWTPSYENFAGEPRRGTHDALLKEQGYVCAYCGRELKENRSDSHIDHFWPQKHFNPNRPPDLTLDYSNFFASCGPPRRPLGDPEREPSTCGDAKGSWFDPVNHVIPSDPNCEARFRYSVNGRVDPVHVSDVAAQNMITRLDLNNKVLVYEREQILAGIEADIAAGEITAVSKSDEITIWRASDEIDHLKSFGHVAARYIEDEPL